MNQTGSTATSVIYPENGSDRSFRIGCDIVQSGDPGCNHMVTNVYPWTLYRQNVSLIPGGNARIAPLVTRLCGNAGKTPHYGRGFYSSPPARDLATQILPAFLVDYPPFIDASIWRAHACPLRAICQ